MSQNLASNPVSTINDLVTFEPQLFSDNCQSSPNLCLTLTLTIKFSQSEEVPILLDDGSIVNIIFGIKTGDLQCTLTNGKMDLNKGNSFDNERYNWRVIHRGIPKAPKWKFTLLNGSEFLEGELKDKCLGIIELSKVGKYFELEAIFKIDSVNQNHIKVICTDSNRVNKLQKETEIGLYLQSLKKQCRLEDYVSRVVVHI